VRSAVITLLAGRHRQLRLQRRGLLAGTRQPDLQVVVAMNDPAVAGVLDHCSPEPDIVQLTSAGGRLPLARARNLGAQRAISRGADLLIFLDVDCVPGRRMVQRYTEHALSQNAPGLWCGPVAYLPPAPEQGYELSALANLGQPHPARPVPPEDGAITGGDHALFWSLSFAVPASLWQDLGGFCEQYTGYGAEDTDFGQLAAGRGIGLTWVGGAWAYHQHHPTCDPPVQHLYDILRNAATFHRRWGWWPMSGWLQEFASQGLIRFEPGDQAWRPVPPTGAGATAASPPR
jgi:GT2 family glycosyltransferase